MCSLKYTVYDNNWFAHFVFGHAGSCYCPTTNKIDMSLLKCLLNGYTSVRKIPDVERKYFVDFMKIALLCNCAWRFKNFHIDHRDIVDARDSYRELKERIEALEDESLVSMIQAAIAETGSIS